MINQEKYKDQGKYGFQRPEPITHTSYHWFFGCLPPVRWTRLGNWEFFHMSERLSGSMVMWAATNNDGIYLEFQDLDTISNNEVYEILEQGACELIHKHTHIDYRGRIDGEPSCIFLCPDTGVTALDLIKNLPIDVKHEKLAYAYKKELAA